MPTHKVAGGWQLGNHGKVYPTKAQADAQGAAAHASGYRGEGKREKPSKGKREK